LRDEIDSLSNRINPCDTEEKVLKKYLLLRKAYYDKEGLNGVKTSNVTAHGLHSKQDFELTKTKEPNYFQAAFLPPGAKEMAKINNMGGYYDYKNDGVWVDFANKDLGGGVFRNGFVQEEIMCLEMPELANAAAQKTQLITRSGSGEGVMEGSPEPLLFSGVRRVLDIEKDHLYGDKWLKVSEFDVTCTYSPFLQSHQHVIVLAMAAPKLKDKSHQKDLDTIKDLFNTFCAGFELVATDASQKGTVTVNTGPIGCGDFANDKVVVHVLQHLAAEYVGNKSSVQFDVNFWGYGDQKENQQIDQDYKDIYKESKGKKIEDLLKNAAGHKWSSTLTSKYGVKTHADHPQKKHR
jgi:hypothetical protein